MKIMGLPISVVSRGIDLTESEDLALINIIPSLRKA